MFGHPGSTAVEREGDIDPAQNERECENAGRAWTPDERDTGSVSAPGECHSLWDGVVRVCAWTQLVALRQAGESKDNGS